MRHQPSVAPVALCLFALLALLAAGATAAACSSSDDGAPKPAQTTGIDDAAAGDDGAADAAVPYPAPHSALPQIFDYGGPVLATPIVIPVFFAGFAYRAQILDFAKKLGPSAHWRATTSEYGIAAFTLAAPIDVATPPQATIYDSDVKAWLTTRFDGTHPDFGSSPQFGAMYTLYYPQTTTIIEGDAPGAGADAGSKRESCQAFGGYHGDVDIKGVFVSYVIVPDCGSFSGHTGADLVTGTSSHEWVEAATDPFFHLKPAYQVPDDAHAAWGLLIGGGEVGDMCIYDEDAFYKPDDVGYLVQRSWSNAAAKAGGDPCVPAAAGAPYFNSAPVLDEDVKLFATTTKGVIVKVGESRVVDVELFSTGPTSGPWTVDVQPFGITRGGISVSSGITTSLSKRTGANGDTIKLTIKAVSPTELGVAGFVLTSTLGKTHRRWVGVVGN